MSKLHSISETRWTRFRAFLRGLLFYNTVYWRRASDAVNRRASRVSRAERELVRPQVDPEILRPRVKPRVHPATPQAIVSSQAPDAEMRRTLPLADETVPGGNVETPTPPSKDPEPELGGGGVVEPERRRRVYRRKQKGISGGADPLRGLARGNAGRPGWWRRLLGLG